MELQKCSKTVIHSSALLGARHHDWESFATSHVLPNNAAFPVLHCRVHRGGGYVPHIDPGASCSSRFNFNEHLPTARHLHGRTQHSMHRGGDSEST